MLTWRFCPVGWQVANAKPTRFSIKSGKPVKKYLLLGLLIFCTDLWQSSGAVLSTTNSGIYLAIGSWQPQSGAPLDENAPLQFDQNFVWEAFSTAHGVRLNYPNPEFGIRVKLLDPDGKESPKTALGKKYGSKFDGVRTYEDVISGTSMGGMDAREKYVERGRGFSGGNLPAPRDLFQMEKTGIYTLQIEMLVFRIIETTATHWDRALLRFPPMKIKVEKPLTAPFFAFSATNHGVCLSIIGTKSNGLAGFDDGLRWRPTGEDNIMLNALDLSSAFKLKLHGPDGKEVPKTALGQTIGVNFDAVRTFGRLPPGIKLTYLDIMPGMPFHVPEQPFPVLKDCFAMEKPGVYTLELQMQLFRIIDKPPYGPEPEELLRFPPMILKVNRP